MNERAESRCMEASQRSRKALIIAQQHFWRVAINYPNDWGESHALMCEWKTAAIEYRMYSYIPVYTIDMSLNLWYIYRPYKTLQIIILYLIWRHARKKIEFYGITIGDAGIPKFVACHKATMMGTGRAHWKPLCYIGNLCFLFSMRNMRAVSNFHRMAF